VLIFAQPLRTFACFAFKLISMTENELSNIIIREANKIHKALGPGLYESVYETCLAYNLRKHGFNVEQQKPILLNYDNVKIDCGLQSDLIINNKFIVEAKSVDDLNESHYAEILTHLRLSNIKLGLLMNFNVVRIKDGIKKIINDRWPEGLEHR
jgi:GxxExxY protein